MILGEPVPARSGLGARRQREAERQQRRRDREREGLAVWRIEVDENKTVRALIETGFVDEQQSASRGACCSALARPGVCGVAFAVTNGQKRTLFTASLYVRFAPESGHLDYRPACPLCAPSGGGTPIGAVVDAVEEMVELTADDIEAMPDFGGEPETQYILGLATIQSGVKILLNIEKTSWRTGPFRYRL